MTSRSSKVQAASHPDVVQLGLHLNPAYALHDLTRGGHAILAGAFHSAAKMFRFGMNPFAADALDRLGDFEDSAATPPPRQTPFNIDFTRVSGKRVGVGQDVVHDTPFGDLVHFNRAGASRLPKLLVVAPMSGHDAKIMTKVVERMLPTHDVFISDWRNARDVPKAAGRFGLDTYVDTLIDWTSIIGANTHLLGVSQSTLPITVATALMAQRKMDTQPASITLMAGPLKPSANHSAISRAAVDHDISLIKPHLIHTVPAHYAGAGRLVYPGQLQNQLIALGAGHETGAHHDFARAAAGKAAGKMQQHQAVPAEMLRPSDLPAEFFLETIERGFRREHLANGTWTHHTIDQHGRVTGTERVDLGAIRNTSVFVVEGGRDTITRPGQTVTIHNMTKNLSGARKFYAFHPEATHYDTISGPIWDDKIAPQIIDFTNNSDRQPKSKKGRQGQNLSNGRVECWTP